MKVGFFRQDGVVFYFLVADGVATRAIPGLEGYWYVLASEEAAIAEGRDYRQTTLTLSGTHREEWFARARKVPRSRRVAIIVENDRGDAFVFDRTLKTAPVLTNPRDLADVLATLDARGILDDDPSNPR